MSDLQLLEIIDSELSNVSAGPPAPSSMEETGLSEGQISDLLLKTLYQHGARTGEELARLVALPYPILDDLLLTFKQRHFIEVLSTQGHGRAGYTLDLTDEGRERANAALENNRYVGPAPVTLEHYIRSVAAQSITHESACLEQLKSAFGDLLINQAMFDRLGPAINSGRGLFLYGFPGNGKSSIAERITACFGGSAWVPHAVTVAGELITFFDPENHEPTTWPIAEQHDCRAGEDW